MLCQTVDNFIPLLNWMQQPAFCIRDDGSVVSNRAAQPLAPLDFAGLSPWLGDAASLFEAWDRDATLELPLELSGCPFRVTIDRLIDGTAFLLAAAAVPDPVDNALSVASQVLRQPLTNLSVMLQQLSGQPELTSAMTRQLYQLTRLTSNLADLARLRSGQYRLRTERLDVNEFLRPLLEELESLCTSAGHALVWKSLAKSVMLLADPMLLERGILNLISNALKFSQPETPIQFRAETNGSYLLLRIRNQCSGGSTELLRAAFSRLEQRDQLPDPRWGIGLGLPITQHIARLHGGMVAVEASNDGWATVTMTLSRRRAGQGSVLASPLPPFEYTGGMRRTLVELAEVLPNSLYHRDKL